MANMIVNREDLAAKAWGEYHKAIKQYQLDDNNDRNHSGNIDYIYDGFFAGFFAACNIIEESK